MAHATPPSLPDLQARGGGGVVTLPLDAVYEILLRLSAKDICRFRAVCRPWRSLLSDPQFIAAHAARYAGPPLVVAGYHTGYSYDGIFCDILDLSGDVVRRVLAAGDEWVTSVNGDYVCTARGFSFSSNIRLFNMTTGAVFSLPEAVAKEHAGIIDRDCSSVAAIGQVASTGQYKVLRILELRSFDDPQQLCEVFTLNGSDHARWRGKNAPPSPVSMSRWKSVVVGDIVYFFGQDSPLEELSSFDLEREEWRQGLQGPNCRQLRTNELSMAVVNGSLVIVHRYLSSYMDSSYMDLCFLMDFEKGLWVKKHSVRAQLSGHICTIRPLLVLNDGRIVLVQIGSDSGLLKIYNPRTDTFADVADVGLCFAVGLYSGSPLNLSNRQMMWLALSLMFLFITPSVPE